MKIVLLLLIPIFLFSKSLDDVIDIVQNINKAKNHLTHYKSEMENAEASGRLPDPVINGGYFINSVETKLGPQVYKAGINQKIPWIGKLSLEREQMIFQAKTVLSEYYMGINSETAKLITNIFELNYLDKIIVLRNEIAGLDSSILQYGSNLIVDDFTKMNGDFMLLNFTNQSEIIKLQNRVLNLNDELFVKYKVHPDSLSSVLDIIHSMEMPITSDLKSNPELMRNNTISKKLNIVKNRNKKDFYPDFGIGLDYTVVDDPEMNIKDGGRDIFLVTAQVTVPLDFPSREKKLQSTKLAIEKNDLEKESIFDELELSFLKESNNYRTSSDLINLLNSEIGVLKNISQRNQSDLTNGIRQKISSLMDERKIVEKEIMILSTELSINKSKIKMLELTGNFMPNGGYFEDK
ncbi:MAG: TolC family protein [Candidatus Delongbacteria bacterium]|nr:TolC family protein [Candidatus Delongbacteria bacterium]MBN2835250.1 TolC family protein [Candidatus Delongbacteria bacterium]